MQCYQHIGELACQVFHRWENGYPYGPSTKSRNFSLLIGHLPLDFVYSCDILVT
jgi:hypothetical protein